MRWELLPGERDDLLSEVEVVGEVLFACLVDEVVVVLPAEDEFDESSVLEGPQQQTRMDVGDVGSLVLLGGEIFMNDDDSFLQQISVDCLFLSFLHLHHLMANILNNI